MNQTTTKTLTIKITGLQALYWMSMCPVYSFASVFLLSRHFQNYQIGIVIAAANVLAAFLQPALGSLADKNPRISLKALIFWIAAVNLVMTGVLVVIQDNLWLNGLLFGAVLALTITIHPLMNSLIFEYVNDGRNINFGMTRGIGSIAFALASFSLGSSIDPQNPILLLLTAAGLFAGIFTLILTFPLTETKKRQLTIDAPENAKIGMGDFLVFLKKYDRFPLFLLGLVFLFIFHTITNAYLVQIINHLGGKESDFGLSLTLAAVCELPVMLGYSFLATKFKSGNLLKVAGGFYVVRSILFLTAANVWMINFAQLFQGLSFALYVPASVYYINKIMQNEDKVKGQTLVVGATTLGCVFGSICGGWLLDRAGVHGMLLAGLAATLIGCVLLLFSIKTKDETGNLHDVSALIPEIEKFSGTGE